MSETPTQETVEMVREFHDACEIPTPGFPVVAERHRLRIDLISEELGELEDAFSNQDLTGVLDALCDLQYVLDGTFLECGMAHLKQVAMREVHRSNMSKCDENGKVIRREDGKILKGSGFSQPALNQFIKEQK